MTEEQRFEIERALDLLPHVAGASWAMVWYRMKGIKNPKKFIEKIEKARNMKKKKKAGLNLNTATLETKNGSKR